MEVTRQTPWLHKFRSSEAFIVIVVSIAIFTDVFIYGMIVPIIPIALVDRAGAREEDAQSWVSILLAVYGAMLLVGSPLFGWFADQSRLRRLPFVVGLLALGASTGLFVLARSLPILVLARALQGLSAAAVWVVGLAIISENVAPERIGEAMGHTTIALTWGFLLGPMVGGLVYEKVGFYATFTVPAGLIVVDIFMRFAMIEKSALYPEDESDSCTDVPCPRSNVYNTFGNDGLSSGDPTSEQEIGGEQAPLLRSSSNGAEECTSTNNRQGTVLHLLLTPRLPLALIAMSWLQCLQHWKRWSSGGTGLVFVVLSVPSFAGVYIGKAINKTGVRILGASAFGLASCSWILMALVSRNTTRDIVLLIGLLLLLGFAIVIIEVTSMTEVSQVISDQEEESPGGFGEKSSVAQAYALFNMAFAGGQLLGPLLAGYLRVQAGWSIMSLVMGLLCGLTAIPLGAFSGPKRHTRITHCE